MTRVSSVGDLGATSQAQAAAPSAPATSQVRNAPQLDPSQVMPAPLLGLLDVARSLFGDGIIDVMQVANAYEWHADTQPLGHAPSAASRSPNKRNDVLNQLDYRDTKLGNGSTTIGRSGCFLATLTMASNRLTHNDRDLRAANDVVRARGGFQGSNLKVDQAADALDLQVVSRNVATPDQMERATAHLDRGNLLFAGVDYKAGKSSAVSRADHFLLIVGREDDKLRAVDPAGGREIVFHRQPNGVYRSGKYEITEVGVLAPKDQRPALANIPRRV